MNEAPNNAGFETIDLGGAIYVPGAEAIINFEPSKDLFKEATTPIKVGNYEIVQWGTDNKMPNNVITKVEASEVVSSNVLFNIEVGYGLGVKPMMKATDGTLTECIDEKVLDFFDTNDINAWYLEQMNDIVMFFQPYSELILDNAGANIIELRSKEASYSRLGVMDNKGKITKHYYSSEWETGAKKETITETSVLDRYNPFLDLTKQCKKTQRFIFIVNMPTPGRPYYPRPTWWSMFDSGWYDYAIMIPKFKTTLLKNKLTLKYIIYVSNKYWDELYAVKKLNITDTEACKLAREEEKTRILDFLKNTGKNAGGGIMVLKKLTPSGNSVIEEKYIEIEEIKNDLKGGEYLEDSQEATSMLCYAQGVHPSLIGAVPGKTGSSLSGTDARERIMIKQSLMAPFRQRPLRVLELIKKFNRWPKELTFVVQDYNFTTLDKNKEGKEIKNNE